MCAMDKLSQFKDYLRNHGFALIGKKDYGIYHDYMVKLNVRFYNLSNTISQLRKFGIYQVSFDPKRDDVLVLMQEDYTNEYDSWEQP